MSDIPDAHTYIEKRLLALDLIEPEPKMLPVIRGEIIIGSIRQERTKKLLILSKVVEKEIDSLSLKIEGGNIEALEPERIRSILFEISKLDSIRRVLNDEFYASLFFECPAIKNHVEPGLFIGVRKDWRIMVVSEEIRRDMSDYMAVEEMRKNLSTPFNN